MGTHGAGLNLPKSMKQKGSPWEARLWEGSPTGAARTGKSHQSCELLLLLFSNNASVQQNVTRRLEVIKQSASWGPVPAKQTCQQPPHRPPKQDEWPGLFKTSPKLLPLPGWWGRLLLSWDNDGNSYRLMRVDCGSTIVLTIRIFSWKSHDSSRQWFISQMGKLGFKKENRVNCRPNNLTSTSVPKVIFLTSL